MRSAALVALVLVLTSCGGGHQRGTATLWVTTDRGAHVLFSGRVPAGLSAMQTLTRVRKVGTRYGGRYVQSIDGVSGSLTGQKDWFLFVNGVESDTGAADVKIRPGDVEWWDYRSWQGGAMTVPVVVGAWPEPFLHGFQWAKKGATIMYASAVDAPVARALARVVGGKTMAVSAAPTQARSDRVVGNAISIGMAPAVPPGITRHKGIVVLGLTASQAAELAGNPAALRYRYQVAP